ncbi:MAG: tRNA threonylcarbamoyladenosine dehydratase [Oscillospiraceae bacterium]|nr:tRNA threonylcarbamoyladenosine dehydratase [Oscillospiraceae bacterium]
MENIFSRSEMLLGTDAMQRLAETRVAVAGIGGVGSFAVEALIRAGVGTLMLIDHDTVAPSNCNRQLHAMPENIGKHKTLLMAQRAAQINPNISVQTAQEFITPDNTAQIIPDNTDYIIDAVDNITAKIALVLFAKERGIPIISVMGAGNKLDPSRFRISDIYSTQVCPLCRIMRRELKKRGVEKLDAVWSDEQPVANLRPPGSVSFVPPVAGMIAAGAVISACAGFRK